MQRLILVSGVARYVRRFLEEQPDVYTLLCRVKVCTSEDYL